MNFEELNTLYKENEKDINWFVNSSMNAINKTIFKRAYGLTELTRLTKITQYTPVIYNNESYEVVEIDYKKGIAVIREDMSSEEYLTVSVDDLEFEKDIAPWNCLGAIYEADGVLTEYIKENLTKVSEIGFEIFATPDTNQIYLTMPMVNSSGIIELLTPLYLSWKKWSDEKFNKLIAQIHGKA